MSFLHQYTTVTDDLDAVFVVSTGRIKVVGINISNADDSAEATVIASDNDDTVLFETDVPPNSSHNINYAMPVDYENGLKFAVVASIGTSVHVVVARSRSL